MEKDRSRVYRRALMSILCVVLSLVITGAIGTTVLFRDLVTRSRQPAAPTQPVLTQQELDALHGIRWENGAAPAMTPDGVTFTDPDAFIGGKKSGIINILLIGQDRRPGQERTRSDSMILCTFRPVDETLVLTSFLRDLYVEIPGYRSNRINTAYEAGGAPLLVKTLEENFGLRVDGSIEVDFDQFAGIIDLLGGVPLELREDEAAEIDRLVPGSDLHAGTAILTGTQALHYSRIRALDADSDFSRTQRQRKVLEALVSQYRQLDLSGMTDLLPELLPLLHTDLTQYQILSYAGKLLPMLEGMTIESQRIPANGSFEDRNIRGMAVLVADMDRNRQILQDTLLPEN